MSKRSQNLTGQWSGEFAYPRHSGPTTPFLANIADRGGRLTGTIIEPDTIHGGVIEAVIVGTRHGASVDLTKTYSPAAPADYAEPVDYVGSLSADGAVIKGVWSLLEWDGTFEMRREEQSEEEVSEQDVVEVSVPSG
jgi:hypothetical protein